MQIMTHSLDPGQLKRRAKPDAIDHEEAAAGALLALTASSEVATARVWG